MLAALFNRLREAHSSADVRAIVVTGANSKFSAGFDINEFAKQSGGGGIDSRSAAGPGVSHCSHCTPRAVHVSASTRRSW